MNLAESWQRLSECMVPADATPSARRNSRPAGMWHALFSNRPRPLLLPVHNRRARRSGVRFFLPLLWHRCYAHLRLQAHDLFGARARLPLLALPATDTPTLSDRLAITEAPQLAFLIGTPGPYQKASMLMMSPRGEPLSLVKIALGDSASAMVRSEAAWLANLNKYDALAGNVPQLLRASRAGNGYDYIAQSIVGGRPCSGAFTAAHADFLRRLGAIECHAQPFATAPVAGVLRGNWRQLAPQLTAAQLDLLSPALADCMALLSTWHGPFVISHGDFAPWNIRVDNCEVHVFDWEYGAGGMPPLFDLLHFHLLPP
jgi:hypothetical protein